MTATAILASKICTRCKVDKLLSEFHKNKSQKDGLNYICIPCANAATQAYQEKNKDKVTARKTAYSNKNKTKLALKMRLWRQENTVKAKEQRKVYAAANKQIILEKSRAYYLANSIKCIAAVKKSYGKNTPEQRNKNLLLSRIKNQNRRDRKRHGGGILSKNLAKNLLNVQKGKCACCGQPLGDNYHLDHIMPLVLGGTNTDDNIQLLRSACNLQKGAKHPIDFMNQRGFLL